MPAFHEYLHQNDSYLTFSPPLRYSRMYHNTLQKVWPHASAEFVSAHLLRKPVSSIIITHLWIDFHVSPRMTLSCRVVHFIWALVGVICVAFLQQAPAGLLIGLQTGKATKPSRSVLVTCLFITYTGSH